MSDVAQSGISPVAVEQAMSVLRFPAGSPRRRDGGYIDLLGDAPEPDLTFVQSTMRSKTVTRIYESLWRPVVARSLFGWRGPRIKAERRLALGMLGVSDGDRVLDVGCGPGTYTRHIAKATGDGLVIGLDPSETMLAAATERPSTANLAYVRGDACALPFGDAEFDAVSCSGAIHLMDDPMQALDEMVRVLGPGGRVMLMATCTRPSGKRHRIGKGVTVFGRDELTSALAQRGMADVEQVVIHKAQFVSARKVGA